MTQPDLFVVCRNCGSEVSPYVTECPYCGQRVRKRAPKLDRSGGEPQPKRRRRPAKLPRLRAEEISGLAPDTRPYATFSLILICLLSLLLWRADRTLNLGYLLVPAVEDVWRFFVAPFLFADQIGYAFVTLVAVGIFGTLIERRFGPLPVVAIFVLCGAAGMALVAYVETPPLFEASGGVFFAFGANGAALGMLCAWLVDDRLAARRGEERENDLLGVYVIAIVLVLLSVAEETANIGAAVGGGLLGALLGLALPLFTRKSVY